MRDLRDAIEHGRITETARRMLESSSYNFRRFFPLESAVIISPAFAQAAPSGDSGTSGCSRSC